MKPRWVETFQMWSETEEYQRRVEEARIVIKDTLKEYKKPYLSFSGGKDSTVMLHLVLQYKEDIPVWHWDYGDQLMPRAFEKEVIENAEKMGVCELIVNKRRGEDARINHKTGYMQFFSQINKLRKEHGWDVGFVGVRQEESCRRKSLYKSFFLNDCCYPLLKLTWMDVWACIVSEGLPYVSVYDSYSNLLGYDTSRFVTFFDKEFEHLGMGIIDGLLMSEFKNK